jgi:malonyl CoA-acyl carrier protein transacylase
MADLVRDRRPDLYTLATALVGEDPFERVDQGTRFAQPAIYCAALAGYDLIARPHAALYAGHSLGELTALVAAGAVGDHDGLRVVAERGRLMEEAGRRTPGGMVAVGGERERAVELAAETGLELANENSPSQFVLSGPERGLERAVSEARAHGLRAKRLAVAGAFHSAAMAPAVDPFRAALDEVEFRPTDPRVISGATVTPFDPDPRGQLAAALTSPVRWVDVVRRLHAEGARRFLDTGPGTVLAGLIRRTLDEVEVRTRAEAEVERV